MASVGFSFLTLTLLLFAGGGFLGSGNVVPLPEDPVVAQVAPAECLFYASWTGKKKASPEATSSTEQLFSDPKFLDYLKRVHEQFQNTLSQGAGPINKEQLDGVSYLLNHLHSHAGSVYISAITGGRKQPPRIFGGLVIRVEDDDLASLTKTIDLFLKLAPAEMQSEVKIDGKQFSRINAGSGLRPITWGIQENYLIVGIGEGEVERMLKRLHTPVPDWLKEAKQAVATPRPASFAHLDIQRILSASQDFMRPRDALAIPGILQAFGLDAIESFSFGGGLDDRGTIHRGQLKLSGELRGMLTLLDCKPLKGEDFGPISKASPAALVVQFNPAEALTAFLDACEHELSPKQDARIAADLRRNIKKAQDQIGVDLHNDFLGSIGDTWRLFVQPGPDAFRNGWTLSIDLSDSAKFSKVHRTLLHDFRQKAGDHGPVKVISQKNEQAEFHSVHINGFPLVPTWAIHKDQLLITTSTVAAHNLLTTSAPEKTLAEAEHIRPFLKEGKRTLGLFHLDVAAVMEVVLPLVAMQLDSLPPGMMPIDSSLLPPLDVITKHLRPTVVAIERTEAGIEFTHRGTLPSVETGQIAPLLVGLVAGRMPAVARGRGAAEAVQGINNQKRIGLALHNFHAAHNCFPAGYSADDNGKPLLSWRVHILPYLENQVLYDQFHLDEPWDSPHNKKLIKQMPDVFRSPRSKAAQGKTTYFGVSGADGIFVRPKDGGHLGIGIKHVTDGTSNTAMTVEMTDKRAIAWTRPGDFAPKKDAPKKGLYFAPQRGTTIGFSDGSVQNIPQGTAKATIMSFFTKSGGEMVRRP